MADTVAASKYLTIKYLIMTCGLHLWVSKYVNQGHIDTKQIFLQTWEIPPPPRSAENLKSKKYSEGFRLSSK